MGGSFSTRWNGIRTRQETGPLLKLDTAILRRQGALEPGTVSALEWTNGGGEPTGSIQLHTDATGDAVTLIYRVREYGGEWRDVRERVDLETTRCNYGGARPWFRCRGCQGRRRVLYCVGGVFRCRQCHDLAYSSTREDPGERAIRRCAELRSKIGGDWGQAVWTIPPKPDDMSWRRYSRIADQLVVEINRASGIFDAKLDQTINRIDHLIAQREMMR